MINRLRAGLGAGDSKTGMGDPLPLSRAGREAREQNVDHVFLREQLGHVKWIGVSGQGSVWAGF